MADAGLMIRIIDDISKTTANSLKRSSALPFVPKFKKVNLEIIDERLYTTIDDPQLLKLIHITRDLFENHFDRTWFSLIIDGLPIDFRTVREIRELVSMESIHPGDERVIYQGVLELEQFVRHVRQFLLPDLKERLRVSCLFPDRMVKDKTAYIIRRFVVYTFPYNLQRLANLAGELRSHLLRKYPYLCVT